MPAMVSTQRAQLEGAPVHTKPGSVMQLALQPSPPVVLASSQVSGAMIAPSPQTGLHIEGAPMQP